ncbi:MAG: hypothetical protein WAS05_06035 [Candidatus Nanopelagicales bacterium]
MYSWIWDKLPGPKPVKLLIALVIFLIVVAVLFQWVFPWVDSVLPLQDVTIDQSSAGSSGGQR